MSHGARPVHASSPITRRARSTRLLYAAIACLQPSPLASPPGGSRICSTAKRAFSIRPLTVSKRAGIVMLRSPPSAHHPAYRRIIKCRSGADPCLLTEREAPSEHLGPCHLL